MKLIAALLMLIALTLTAHAGHTSPPASGIAGPAAVAQHAAADAGRLGQHPSRPAHKERSRRTARIDLTMPFYRFGRLPIRIKD